MLITEDVIHTFKTKAEAADEGIRFRRSGLFQKTSSLSPVYRRLNQAQARHEDLEWAHVQTTVAAIPVDKQQKYSEALKYLQKTLGGHGSKMFESLRLVQNAVKLSKSQQRYVIPMLSADRTVTAAQREFAEHGVCFNLAMLWLKEQFLETPLFQESLLVTLWGVRQPTE
jgi:hypothetical protein